MSTQSLQYKTGFEKLERPNRSSARDCVYLRPCMFSRYHLYTHSLMKRWFGPSHSSITAHLYANIFLLLLARVVAKYLRMGFVAVFSLICTVLGSWHFSCFTGGMLLAEHNPHQEVSNTQPTRHSIIWALLFGIAF
jgi:hypothetical protein